MDWLKYSTAVLRKPDYIQLGIFSPDLVVRMV